MYYYCNACCLMTHNVGTDCVVEVTGYFCCACRELWKDGDQGLTKKHCATEKHRQNYEVSICI